MSGERDRHGLLIAPPLWPNKPKILIEPSKETGAADFSAIPKKHPMAFQADSLLALKLAETAKIASGGRKFQGVHYERPQPATGHRQYLHLDQQ
ncbi:hypothetical protein GOZ95_01675 [Agrobacterium vitis]|uniref:Uncharacterized protein n=1 Tax=Agrobacterium vitis TaxID=373 RepID=A0AAE4W985_AGRVI|nr:hypothetical protein [Allorhizobium sp. Av2]MUZ56163.1 hypothetical protein [Agrobacterium vitis]